MLVSFNKKIIRCLPLIFSHCCIVLLAEMRDLEHATRPKSRTSTSYENALWTNGISWNSASSTKSLESGERGFELVWLQKENSLNIRPQHFSLLTFCYVLFLKGRLIACMLVD